MKIKLLDKNCMPYKKYYGDAGWDLKAKLDKPVELSPFTPQTIPTGIAVEIPYGYVGDIRPRSSLARKGVVAQYGTVDSTYRGEVKVTLINLISLPAIIEPYERIAQLVVVPVLTGELKEVNVLSKTERGSCGFGSTGRF